MQRNGILPASGGNAKIVYILYLAGLVFWPAAVVGVVTVYLDRASEAAALAHPRFQLRTVGIGLFQWAVGFAILALSINFSPIVPVLGLLPLLSPVASLALLLWMHALVLTAPVPAAALQHMAWWLLVLLLALLLWGLFWWTKRCLRGLRCLSRQEPHPNPGTWLW